MFDLPRWKAESSVNLYIAKQNSLLTFAFTISSYTYCAGNGTYRGWDSAGSVRQFSDESKKGRFSPRVHYAKIGNREQFRLLLLA